MIVYTMYQVKGKLGQVKPYQVIIPINGKRITMKVDTGVIVTVMSEFTVTTIKNCPQLQKKDTKLHTYAGNQLKVKGSFEGECGI